VAAIDGMSAYFDASGTKRKQSVWAVGGWIGTAQQWEALEDQWRRMIDAAHWRDSVPRAERIHHAADLESCLGIYKG
jgi:hypothetical protein